MRFKIDENLPSEAAEILRTAGHDAVTVLEEKMGGQSDARVSEAILRERRALVTLDLDFADIRTYPPAQYPGLIVLRMTRQDKSHVLKALENMLPLLNREPVRGRLWIVGEETVRLRGDRDDTDENAVRT